MGGGLFTINDVTSWLLNINRYTMWFVFALYYYSYAQKIPPFSLILQHCHFHKPAAKFSITCTFIVQFFVPMTLKFLGPIDFCTF